MLSFSEIFAENFENGFLALAACEMESWVTRSVSSSWFELFPRHRTGKAQLASSRALPRTCCFWLQSWRVNESVQWRPFDVKCRGAKWQLEGSTVPFCFTEKSALDCGNEWSGCVAGGKSLPTFVLIAILKGFPSIPPKNTGRFPWLTLKVWVLVMSPEWRRGKKE